MKRLVLGLAVLATTLVLAAGVATAQTGHFAFDDCGGANTKAWTCTTNTGAACIMVASVNPPAGLTTLSGQESYLEIAFPTAVPAWWTAGTSQCRLGSAIAVAFAAPLSGGCVDYFGNVGAGPSGGSSLTFGPGSDPVGPVDANRMRVRTLSAVDVSGNPTPPASTDEVFLFTVTVNKSKSTGTGACTGCDSQICAMLKHVKFTQPAGVGDFTWDGSVLITGQTQTVDCVTVPTHTTSWGQIKSLYR